MDEKPQTDRGVTTRLKRRQRGWHHESHPGFYGVRDAFDRADREQDGEKLAAIRERAWRDVLGKFALLDNEAQPIEALSNLFATSNFGYGDDDGQRRLDGGAGRESSVFGKAIGGPPTEVGDQRGATSFISNGSV